MSEQTDAEIAVARALAHSVIAAVEPLFLAARSANGKAQFLDAMLDTLMGFAADHSTKAELQEGLTIMADRMLYIVAQLDRPEFAAGMLKRERH